MNFNIRKAEEKDIPQLIELFREFSVFEKKPDKMVNSIEKMKKQFEYFECFLASNTEGQIIGYLSYFFCYYTWSGKSLYMDDFYIKPEYRGNNLGSMLISRLKQLGKKEGCYKIRWQVAKWNKGAEKLYLSMGAEIEDDELDCDLILY